MRTPVRTICVEPGGRFCEGVGVGFEVSERVIAQLVGSAVSRVYDRNEYLREKRAALDAWTAELSRIVSASANS